MPNYSVRPFRQALAFALLSAGFLGGARPQSPAASRIERAEACPPEETGGRARVAPATAIPIWRIPVVDETLAAVGRALQIVGEVLADAEAANAGAMASRLLVPGDSVIVRATPLDPTKPANDVLPGSLRREFPGEHLGKCSERHSGGAQVRARYCKAVTSNGQEDFGAGRTTAVQAERIAMNWYAAKLLFQSEIDRILEEDHLWEESIRLLMAENEDEARDAAVIVGKAAEHSYLNETGETVCWRFREVQEIQDLCVSELTQGSEVFSRLFRQ